MRKFWTLLAVLLLAACGLARAAGQTHHIHGTAFGTPVEISIHGGSVERANELGAQVLDEFARLHRKLHAWEPSALTALNDAIAKGETYQADAELVYLLKTAA
ncbi:MAG TPA: FAD:protein FMN transferase, partial [Telluria sp.]|nr:FAD:protein FMN transferase [Telluria sp.]